METKQFQIILYVVFGIFTLLGFGTLALYGALQRDTSQDQEGALPDILLWGTLDEREIDPVANQLSRFPDRGYNQITYVEKSADTIWDEYLESIALGRQPDLLLIDHNTVSVFEDTLQTIPFSYLSRSQYTQQFIPSADLFIRDGGYIALPFLADILVLYYNENLRLAAGIRAVPNEWSDLLSNSYLGVNQAYQESQRALIPLGAYANYQNAPDVFFALLQQVAASQTGLTQDSVEDILSFYTSFAAPGSPTYTWNVSYPSALDMFTSNQLLLYPGYISELRTLTRSNATIPVRVAPLPQISSMHVPATPATLYAFAVPRSSRAPGAAVSVAFSMIGVFYDPANDPSALFSLPPALQGYYPDSEATVTESVFINSLFSAQAEYLSAASREAILQVLRDVVVGVLSPASGAMRILDLFQ